MKIYLDNCCLNRPYDDLTDDIVRLEAEAVLSIISGCESGRWELLVSEVLLDEILTMPSLTRKQKVLILYNAANINIALTNEIVARAKAVSRLPPYDGNCFAVRLYNPRGRILWLPGVNESNCSVRCLASSVQKLVPSKSQSIFAIFAALAALLSSNASRSCLYCHSVFSTLCIILDCSDRIIIAFLGK
ncbi:hypothetical protein FACS1894217_15640 [Clostridia bacterium]|nr:hypothetical protein FACS1894217_15640 [Clostridia bacterium]